MSKSIVIGLVGASAILLAILLTGCSDAPSPTPSARSLSDICCGLDARKRVRATVGRVRLRGNMWEV